MATKNSYSKKRFGVYEVSGHGDCVTCRVFMTGGDQFIRLKSGDWEFSEDAEFTFPVPVEWDCWIESDGCVDTLDEKANFCDALREMILRQGKKNKGKIRFITELFKNAKADFEVRAKFLSKLDNLVQVM